MSFVGFIAGAPDDQQQTYRRAIRAAVKQTYGSTAKDITWLVEERVSKAGTLTTDPSLLKLLNMQGQGIVSFVSAA